MLNRNEDEALNEKRKLEVIQRTEAKERDEKNQVWVPKHFVKRKIPGNVDNEDFYCYEEWEWGKFFLLFFICLIFF